MLPQSCFVPSSNRMASMMLNNLFGKNLWHLEYADDMILASHDLDILQKALYNLAKEGR